jgi:hypothetical protein
VRSSLTHPTLPTGDARIVAVGDPRFDDLTPDVLRARGGSKWNKYQPDVLAAWVADMDFPLAPAVAEALHRAVEDGMVVYPNLDLGHDLLGVFAERSGSASAGCPTPTSPTSCPT